MVNDTPDWEAIEDLDELCAEYARVLASCSADDLLDICGLRAAFLDRRLALNGEPDQPFVLPRGDAAAWWRAYGNAQIPSRALEEALPHLRGLLDEVVLARLGSLVGARDEWLRAQSDEKVQRTLLHELRSRAFAQPLPANFHRATRFARRRFEQSYPELAALAHEWSKT